MFGYLSPDGKSQVTVKYENGIPKRVETVVISTQHNPDVEIAQLREDISEMQTMQPASTTPVR